MDIKLTDTDHDEIFSRIKSYKKLDKIYEEGGSLLARGDCLRTLKTIYEQGLNKVKLVYIDPPFSTNTEFRISENGGRTSTISSSKNDVLAYSDKLTGEEYLDFIRNVLIALKKVMTEDSSIYFHIDYKIGHYVKIIMDEVFGIDNFKNDITRIKCNPKNFHRRSYGNIKDLILFYAQGDYVWNNPTAKHSALDIERLFPKIDKNGRRYTTNPLHAPGETSKGESGQDWNGLKPPAGRHWRHSIAVLNDLEEKGLIEWSKNGNPRKIIYAHEQVKKGKKLQDIWEFKDPVHPQYPTQKNIDLLKQIIVASSNEGDVVLDCFAGSGTTLVAAKSLGRNCIGIDRSEHALRITQERLKSTSINASLLE